MTTFSTDDRERQDLGAALEEIRHLQRALSTRPVIDQAKGMLMARHGCTADEAFGMLVAASQRSNRSVSELARSIVEHVGEPPRPRVGRPSVSSGQEHGMIEHPVDNDGLHRLGADPGVGTRPAGRTPGPRRGDPRYRGKAPPPGRP